MAHPISDQARTAWLLLRTRYHERQHFLNLLKKLYRFSSTTGETWEAYDSSTNRDRVLDETSAKITEARYAAPDDRSRELLDMIATLVNQKAPRLERLQYLNLLDRLLTHLAAHLKNYPELRIQFTDSLSIRAQISGQLYRLTPDSLGRAWEAVHVAFESHPYEALMPEQIDPLSILQTHSEPRAALEFRDVENTRPLDRAA